MTTRTGVLKIFAGAFVASAFIASCGAPAQKAAPAAPPLPAGLVGEMPRTLTADEAANLAVAIDALPSTATLSHVVTDGSLVALHYTNATASGPVVVAEFNQFDTAHAVTKRDHVEYASDPTIHLTGASFSVPEAADNEVEQTNKTAIYAFVDALNRAKLDDARGYLADTFVDHTSGDKGAKTAWLASLRDRTRPRQEIGIQSIAAWNDMVAAYSAVGTSGADGKVQYSPGYDFFRLKDGKIVERWRVNY